MTEAIEDERYDWPRGESPRDIVDTHALADSQHVDRVGSVARFSWGDGQVDYAIAVHEGEDSKPARRWTREAIRGDETAPLEWQNSRAMLDVPAYFTDKFRANYRG
jgi:NADPH-dependent ferric siderophore reductase